MADFKLASLIMTIPALDVLPYTRVKAIDRVLKYRVLVSFASANVGGTRPGFL